MQKNIYTTLKTSSKVVNHFIAFNIQSSFINIKSESLALLTISSLDAHSLIKLQSVSFKVIISMNITMSQLFVLFIYVTCLLYI